MLDTSVAYKKIIMKLNGGDNKVTPPVLPDGFTCRLYQKGDEHHWARIETSVGEFTSEELALQHYAYEFLPHTDELKRRCVFICSPDGIPAATGSAWLCIRDGVSYPRLHWIAVSPDFQRMGLGRSVVQKVLSIFRDLSPYEDIWLSTQTWSHDAVRLYHTFGFTLMRTDSINLITGDNPAKQGELYDLSGALEILKQVYDPLVFQDMYERIG